MPKQLQGREPPPWALLAAAVLSRNLEALKCAKRTNAWDDVVNKIVADVSRLFLYSQMFLSNLLGVSSRKRHQSGPLITAGSCHRPSARQTLITLLSRKNRLSRTSTSSHMWIRQALAVRDCKSRSVDRWVQGQATRGRRRRRRSERRRRRRPVTAAVRYCAFTQHQSRDTRPCTPEDSQPRPSRSRLWRSKSRCLALPHCAPLSRSRPVYSFCNTSASCEAVRAEGEVRTVGAACSEPTACCSSSLIRGTCWHL